MVGLLLYGPSSTMVDHIASPFFQTFYNTILIMQQMG
jgi:hypothetical protein